jgi:anti-sigma B factor antagonist
MEVRPVGSVTVVAVHGDVDVMSSPRLRECLLNAMEDGALDFVLDLEACHLLDSTGLGVIDAAARSLRRRHGHLAVACATPRIRRLFSVTRLDRRIRVVGALDEALPAPL